MQKKILFNSKDRCIAAPVLQLYRQYSLKESVSLHAFTNATDIANCHLVGLAAGAGNNRR